MVNSPSQVRRKSKQRFGYGSRRSPISNGSGGGGFPRYDLSYAMVTIQNYDMLVVVASVVDGLAGIALDRWRKHHFKTLTAHSNFFYAVE